MIEETYAVFAAWDFDRPKRENLDRLRDENFIGASSTTWLRDVAKVLNRRFDPDGRDRALVVLAKSGCDLDEWKPLLLWHITRDEFLLRDFLQNWLFPAYEPGTSACGPTICTPICAAIRNAGGTTEHAWTRYHAEACGRGTAENGGRLRAAARQRREGVHVLPPARAQFPVSPSRDAGRDSRARGKMIDAPDWRMFLMRPADVEQ